MVLTKQQIIESNDLVTKTIPVPQWGGVVIVREAMSRDREEYDRSLVDTQMVNDKPTVVTNYDNAKARLVVKCLVDEQGNRLFSDAEAEVLGRKNANVIERLFNEITTLSKMGWQAIKDAEKNFGGTPDGSSSSV
jgi:hypothetical protein